MNYYNEFDHYAAQWLRNLIAAGRIAPGIVDERSIEDVHPSDLRGFVQCHFFAGIGVWSHSLRLAGWPDDRPVWTGSCPCQPFSAAGKGAGFDDERHLWPAFHHLIKECNPAIVLGEQVASKAVDPWIDLVHADLETLGYAFGCVPFPSAGVGAPHIRDRLYWVGDARSTRLEGHTGHGGAAGRKGPGRSASKAGVLSGMANAKQHHRGSQTVPAHHGKSQAIGPTDWAGGCGGSSGWVDNAVSIGRGARRDDDAEHDWQQLDATSDADWPGPTNGFWRYADWLGCRDDKWRPVEPGTFPLVNGLAGGVGRVRADQERITSIIQRKDQGSRVGRLRGYGNAINAQAAIEMILAVSDAANEPEFAVSHRLTAANDAGVAQ